ncbi:MAG: FecR domain-containing protein [Alphaproteobacteria bacterium]|nr:FecR domain-containing protein [Alphaproteobacteria bacterium]
MTGHRSGRAAMTRIVVTIMMTLLAGAAVAETTIQVVGITSAIVNNVTISSVKSSQPRRAVLRQRIALADRVQTGTRSQLQVLLLDKSVFTVGANARLTIDRYVYDPNGGGAFGVSVAKGAFRFMSGRPDRGSGSSINTPVAVIGIRGTIVDGVVGPEAVDIVRRERVIDENIKSDPDTASLVILRGPGERTQGNATIGAITVAAGGKVLALDQPMLAAYVPAPGAPPIGPFKISGPGLARVIALIFPTLAEQRRNSPPASATPAYPPSSPYYRREPLPPPDSQGVEPGNVSVPAINSPEAPIGQIFQGVPDRPVGQQPQPTQQQTPPPNATSNYPPRP